MISGEDEARMREYAPLYVPCPMQPSVHPGPTFPARQPPAEGPPLDDSLSSKPRTDPLHDHDHDNRFMTTSPVRRIENDRHNKESPDGAPPDSGLHMEGGIDSPAQLALSAIQFLPLPMLVLSDNKTIVLANKALGKLLGLIESEDGSSSRQETSPLDRLRGQTLQQIGIDMLKDGIPVWISWDDFLDDIPDELKASNPNSRNPSTSHDHRETSTPRSRNTSISGQTPSNIKVNAVISRPELGRPVDKSNGKGNSRFSVEMMVNVWEPADGQRYFTLIFSDNDSALPYSARSSRMTSRRGTAQLDELEAIASGHAPTPGSDRGRNSSPWRQPEQIRSASSKSPFPPLFSEARTSAFRQPTIMQKVNIIKDALLDNTEMPMLAMWKDASVSFPNRAARDIFHTDKNGRPEGEALLAGWAVYNEDFSRKIEISEYPISILMRTQKPFTGYRIGLYTSQGEQRVYDVLGELITDPDTGEFLAGVVTCRDVTDMIMQIKEKDEERFRLICDGMPQLVWTSTPDGKTDFFNSRWTEYTDLSKKECLGLGWTVAIHPEDLAETHKKWMHSVETGQTFQHNYRIRDGKGSFRWFLGRALPVKHGETGRTEKWFGTCTDVHESTEAKLSARRTREQLLNVLAHGQVSILTIDKNRKVTMLEGALIWDANADDVSSDHDERWYLGLSVDEVFKRLNPHPKKSQRPDFLQPIEDVLTGRISQDLQEHGLDDKWYRTRFLPILGKDRATKVETIEGVIGVILDVTKLKEREKDLERQDKERQQLLANEHAAKEASRLKSQFLANMSHEIRTPITGVIGMAELLLDLDTLDDESREYAENIYRSGNGLLTVINDILDFSKVESGRLDIEEVQFSLSMIIKDVNKMLSFAAERKSLDFRSEISDDIQDHMVVIGDPGRVRQIITNLLTNSIKFTHQGHVRFSASKRSETADRVEIEFVVEDTGIGMEEDVLNRLFQPFSQGDASTARKFGGTGLGLTICKNLLGLMKGRIDLKSVQGSGTTAKFWIPFSKPLDTQNKSLVDLDGLPDRLASEMSVSCNSSEYDQMLSVPAELQSNRLGRSRKSKKNPHVSHPAIPPGATLEDVLPASDREKVHVLVVEDNAINQQIATKTIRKLGFNVTAAWNGKEALEYLTAAQEGKNRKPDIILMDVQMPVIDGYKCTHLLRHHPPYRTYVHDIPIVAMTASAIQGDKEKCRRAGMDDYLAKPVKSRILERMLVRWTAIGEGGSRRQPPSNPESASSDCSASGEHCSNADIPAVGHDEDYNSSAAVDERDANARNDLPETDLTVLTPTAHPAGKGKNRAETQGYFSIAAAADGGGGKGSSSPQAPQASPRLTHHAPDNAGLSRRHTETEEMAMQLRDDKLMAAAVDSGGGNIDLATPSGPSAGNEEGTSALTEENMEILAMEEEEKLEQGKERARRERGGSSS